MEAEKMLREGIWRWYNFKQNSSVFFVENDSVLEGKYDYVVALSMPETYGNPVQFLTELKSVLNPGGTLLLGFDNSLGYRYFCGDIPSDKRKPFTKSDIKKILGQAGLTSFKFYSVLPDLDFAQLIYADSFVPAENLSIRYLPLYNNPDTVFRFEEAGYSDLIANGIFHPLANSFLVECNEKGLFDNALQVTMSSDRGKELAYATIIRENLTVTKKPLFDEGKKSLLELNENLCKLKKLGIKVVEGKIYDGELKMPFVDAKLGNVYLQQLAARDKDLFIKKMDYFVDLIYKSAKNGVCYFDFVPLNSFYSEDDFVFFDQEFALSAEKYPPEMLVYRSIVIVYSDFAKMDALVPALFFWKRYGILERLEELEALSHNFLMSLRKQNELAAFNAAHQRKDVVVSFNSNQHSATHFYDGLLSKDCFDSLESKKVYVFGGGKFADKFLAMYKNDYDICGIVDNNSEKWGSKLRSIKISSPKILLNLSDDSVVVICVKDFKPVYAQLVSMNVKTIVLYEAHRIYFGRQKLNVQRGKKYHIGYLSGVFDLYHIGHINMFRRAKEMCDYLIVGVTSDEYVINHKKRTPFIPAEERRSVVASCKFVDEVVEIPYGYDGIVEAFQKYHYDVQFCGSDYETNPWWLEQQKWLREHGSDLVFFPYTQQTSSTKIKSLIDKGLL